MSPATSCQISPFDITPLPQVKKRTSNRGRKACKSTVITSTPYKTQLEEAKKAKEEKEAQQKAKNRITGACRGNRKKGKQLVKKRLSFDERDEKVSGSEADESVSSGNSELEVPPGVIPAKEDDAACMFCDRKFSEDNKGELWARSSKGQPLEHQQQTAAQYYQDFGHTSATTSPENYPSASPSPAESPYSSMNKKARTLDHVQLLRQNPAARRVYKMCQALPLFPAHMVEAGYDHIVNYAQQAGVLQNLPAFLNYVRHVRITEETDQQRHGVLPQETQRYHEHCPSEHGLRALEHEASVTLHRGLNAVRPPRPRNLLFDRTINTLTTRLDSGQYSVREFFEAASHQLDNIYNEVYNVAGDDDADVVGVDVGRLRQDKEAGGRAAVEQWQEEVVSVAARRRRGHIEDWILKATFGSASACVREQIFRQISRVFAFLKEVLPDWYPSVIICEFEKALTIALRRAWPESRVAGCWFHSANSMNKKAQTLGHVQLLRQNPAARRVYKMCQDLPLLPAHMVEAGYNRIVNYAQ
ncbi:hypothetical protein J6590_079987 [Homalodisca vitripennis]|nr:hypothetical protein J6590_079987 [Homalodisca vitripennis]